MVRSRWKEVAFWVVSVLLGLMFFFSGGSKIFGAEMQVESFARWGLPDLLRPMVGGVEVLAALLLFFPWTRFWGGAVIALTMVGAALTHLVSGADVQMVAANAILFLASAGLAWAHRPAIGARSIQVRSVVS